MKCPIIALSALLISTSVLCAADQIPFTTKKELQEKLNDSKPTIIMCSATWCGPCNTMKPRFRAIADEQKEKFNFCIIDVEDKAMSEIVESWDIQAMPTFVFCHNNVVLHTHVGSLSKPKLEKEIKAFSEKIAKQPKPVEKTAALKKKKGRVTSKGTASVDLAA